MAVSTISKGKLWYLLKKKTTVNFIPTTLIQLLLTHIFCNLINFFSSFLPKRLDFGITTKSWKTQTSSSYDAAY